MVLCIRGGVLEAGKVQMLHDAGVGVRLAREGIPHDSCYLSSDDELIKIDLMEACGKQVAVYGQTEVTQDLYDAQYALCATILHGVSDVALHDLQGDAPYVTLHHDSADMRLDCAYVMGCDGFHGISRPTIHADVWREFEKVYPFGWLGVLKRTPPATPELIYANHELGFALASMRNPMLSRYYILVPLTDTVEDWSDEAFWAELLQRFPPAVAASIVTGHSIEKSIAPLHSFVWEPIQWGRLFLCGDAAHLVPPTGAKGLNLAVSDIHYLSRALVARYRDGNDNLLARCGQDTLARVWQAMRFSWQLTMLIHRFPDQTEFDRRMQVAELTELAVSPDVLRMFSRVYTGLPNWRGPQA